MQQTVTLKYSLFKPNKQANMLKEHAISVARQLWHTCAHNNVAESSDPQGSHTFRIRIDSALTEPQASGFRKLAINPSQYISYFEANEIRRKIMGFVHEYDLS